MHPSTCLLLDKNFSASQQSGHADYGFEYSDEEVEEEDVDIENQYYNSKGKAHRQMSAKTASSMQTLPTIPTLQVCWRAAIRQKL